MAFVAGIDEAGYGPLLGPLVVAGTLFEVPSGSADACLWRQLAGAVSRRPSSRGYKLPIADSKKLHNPSRGIAMLERTALVMWQTATAPAMTLRDLLGRSSSAATAAMDRYPWYKEYDLSLPSAASADEIAVRVAPLRRACRDAGVRLARLFIEPTFEGHYNERVAASRNKSNVLIDQTFAMMARLAEAADGPDLHIHVDRQGGRTHYRERLMTSFDGHDLRIVEEGDERSAYELAGRGRTIQVEFVTGGEEKHLPIALASIYAKYVRELLMIGFNRYWADRVPGLRPTAGYYTDGQRFLRDIDAAIDQHRIDRHLLVRSR